MTKPQARYTCHRCLEPISRKAHAILVVPSVAETAITGQAPYMVHPNCRTDREFWEAAVALLYSDPHRRVSENYARLPHLPQWFEYPDWADRKCSALAKRLQEHLDSTT